MRKLIGGIGLISGTAIGAGMLALPVATYAMGLMNSILIFTICWFFMTVSALYFLEATLKSDNKETNLVSMSEKFLGMPGKITAWTAYLLLLYALIAAYTSGTSAWVANTAMLLFETKLLLKEVAMALALFLSITIYAGISGFDKLNRFFIILFCIAFVFILSLAFANLNTDLLLQQPAKLTINSIPLIITAFGYHIVIPSLHSYLQGNSKQLHFSILVGSTVPLLIYILWLTAVFGILPATGEHGLAVIAAGGNPATDIAMNMSHVMQSSLIMLACKTIAISVLVTSIIGVTISLFDFLADGIKVRKTKKNIFLLSILVFIPPLLFVTHYPQGFMFVLSFGGIFVAILLGILPAMMALRSRDMHPGGYQVFGGKTLSWLSIIFFTIVIAIELFNQAGIIY